MSSTWVIIPTQSGSYDVRPRGKVEAFMKRKLNSNDPCYCGSGQKYKKCCASVRPWEETEAYRYLTRYGIILKTENQINKIRKSGLLVAETLDMVEKMLRPGLTTDEINTAVHNFTIDHGAIPAPLGYRGYPKSCCTSINEVVCHGIPGDTVLAEGDILNVDVTSILDGYYADANKTFGIGEISPDAARVIECSRLGLERAIECCRPGAWLSDIGTAIQEVAREMNCTVVRDFVGHGTGIKFHEEPQVVHYATRSKTIPLKPGMVFTIEPMINLGTWKVKVLKDGWTAITQDGALSAQFEHTIAITDGAAEILTSLP